MAFKSAKEYVEDKYKGLLVLANDGDSADVIFLYQNENDALVCDAHYVKSDAGSGYVQCLGRGCPACEKGLRVQTKLFIPLYNITTQEVLFWDRNIRFQSQLQQDVFSKFPNPSEFVFRITRHGAAGSIDTTYSIEAIAKNTVMSFAEICASKKISFPDYFNTICPEIDITELRDRLNSYNTNNGDNSSSDALPNYRVTPRTPASKLAQVSGDSVAEPPVVVPDAIGDDELGGTEPSGVEGLDDDDVNF